MAKGDDIRERLVDLAVAVIGLCEEIPQSATGSHMSGQFVRSATSAAANYAEARGAESARDFVHKLGIVLKELNEAEVWIDILVKRQVTAGADALRIQGECKTLCRIIGASVRTAQRNIGRGPTLDGTRA